jgi:hypothetical protein
MDEASGCGDAALFPLFHKSPYNLPYGVPGHAEHSSRFPYTTGVPVEIQDFPVLHRTPLTPTQGIQVLLERYPLLPDRSISNLPYCVMTHIC